MFLWTEHCTIEEIDNKYIYLYSTFRGSQSAVVAEDENLARHLPTDPSHSTHSNE